MYAVLVGACIMLLAVRTTTLYSAPQALASGHTAALCFA